MTVAWNSSTADTIWMGDMWGSTLDKIKGRDLQYWGSSPKFDKHGMIEPLVRENTWVLELPMPR